MTPLDRVKDPFARLVRWVTRDLRFSKWYPATVLRQAGNLTVDLLPDDAVVKGVGTQGVEILSGLPVAIELVSTAARKILLGYEASDPKRPVAALWRSGGTIRLGTLAIATTVNPPPGTGTSVTALDFFEASSTGDAGLAAFLITNPPPIIVFQQNIETSQVRIV